MGTTAEKLAYLANTKADIRAAMVEKGIEVPENTPFREYAEKIAAIPSKMAQTYIPGKENQIIDAGQYLKESQTIQGDANLLPENIVSGKSIFGVAGNAPSKKIAIFPNISASVNDESATFNIGKGLGYDTWDVYISEIYVDMYGFFSNSYGSIFEVEPNKYSGEYGTIYASVTHPKGGSGWELRRMRATIILVEP